MDHLQALTNQLLSNVCLRTPFSKYLFVNVPNQGQPQYAYGFSNFSLNYAFNMLKIVKSM